MKTDDTKTTEENTQQADSDSMQRLVRQYTQNSPSHRLKVDMQQSSVPPSMRDDINALISEVEAEKWNNKLLWMSLLASITGLIVKAFI